MVREVITDRSERSLNRKRKSKSWIEKFKATLINEDESILVVTHSDLVTIFRMLNYYNTPFNHRMMVKAF